MYTDRAGLAGQAIAGPMFHISNVPYIYSSLIPFSLLAAVANQFYVSKEIHVTVESYPFCLPGVVQDSW